MRQPTAQERVVIVLLAVVVAVVEVVLVLLLLLVSDPDWGEIVPRPQKWGPEDPELNVAPRGHRDLAARNTQRTAQDS